MVATQVGIKERFEIFLDDNGYSRKFARTKLLEILIEVMGSFLIKDLK